ncbi:MAG: hypothetical protein JW881_06345 [Spirochaetales bacterium]|nr:hypothetical protein [Spirochaetales bacterium]
MKRIEIIANRSIEEDLFDIFRKKDIVHHYTKIPIAFGVGNKGPRMGDHIWPEENFILIIYCDEMEAVKIRESIFELKEFFKSEGIKLFEMNI